MFRQSPQTRIDGGVGAEVDEIGCSHGVASSRHVHEFFRPGIALARQAIATRNLNVAILNAITVT